MAALLAPLLSIATLSESLLARIALVEEALRRSHVALRRQQEVDGLASLVDGAVEVLPGAVDLDVRFIDVPPGPDGVLVFRAIFL